MLTIRRADLAVLASTAVDEGHRRLGVGGALVEAVTRRPVTDWGCDQVELTSSRSGDAAHAFYPALGYRDTSSHHARYVREL